MYTQRKRRQRHILPAVDMCSVVTAGRVDTGDNCTEGNITLHTHSNILISLICVGACVRACVYVCVCVLVCVCVCVVVVVVAVAIYFSFSFFLFFLKLKRARVAEVYSGCYKVSQSTTKTCFKYATSIKTETIEPIRRFGEAGLSREVAASLPGRFLNRRCFKLCITMEVEPRIA